MNKKNRVPFSAFSIEEKNPAKAENKTPLKKSAYTSGGQKMSDKKRQTKSSSYQYSKKRYSGRNRPMPGHNRDIKLASSNIPPPDKDIVRIIPLGGVEEIGKNMTAIEINDDIIVIDAGMHFSTEETPGVDYVIPNTTCLLY